MSLFRASLIFPPMKSRFRKHNPSSSGRCPHFLSWQCLLLVVDRKLVQWVLFPKRFSVGNSKPLFGPAARENPEHPEQARYEMPRPFCRWNDLRLLRLPVKRRNASPIAPDLRSFVLVDRDAGRTSGTTDRCQGCYLVLAFFVKNSKIFSACSLVGSPLSSIHPVSVCGETPMASAISGTC